MRQIPLALLAVAAACAPADRGDDPADLPGGRTTAETSVSRPEEAALRLTLERAHALADSIEETLRPVPLMRPADETALRRYGQSVQLPRARALGARPADEAELEALTRAGRLVPLEDSTRFWILRDLRSSRAFVTPDTRVLLERIGEAFQERLDAMGIPPYRLEITSALRSAADQARLRRTNVNAAGGVSTHEYGTTVDIAYSAYAPPQELPDGIVDDADAPPWMVPYLDAVARPVLESVSARKSRELQAILGEVLREAQSDGLVLVTLERLQPVYHITVARRLAGGDGG
ncbi:MAG: hypothetical protein KY466_11875 [Gemmatimonadetes bacterium]|nr:hypothetical protein [Gemmatimonadota bacterium]